MFTEKQWEEIRQAKQRASLAKRREKIAALIMAGMFASGDVNAVPGMLAKEAVKAADALIAELDKGVPKCEK